MKKQKSLLPSQPLIIPVTRVLASKKGEEAAYDETAPPIYDEEGGYEREEIEAKQGECLVIQRALTTPKVVHGED
ncbi:hypothetical protein Pyn_02265 [Prunus yedoensis var. nudiflora]|uniref:Uncharacterized protein n=1 Tax=Prunus yedoensis var. nudiflora TaxID=2094558 RepID=A0A314UNU7_PRUYE|nr:hypothetical protein Pyn_02265 [Prunus yedoensis var. nudiflora]